MRVQKWWLEAVVLLFATGWLCLSTPVGKRSPLLPHSLTPESYELSLNPDIIRGVFHGVVIISGVAVAETSVIVLHCSNLLFNMTKLSDTTEGEEVAVLGVEEDEFLQQCHLSLNKTLRVDHEYKLTIEFMGIIGHDGFGLYEDFYKEGGVRKQILMTHLQPNYARTMFPCWDEPHYKAQFLVKVTRGRFPTVLSNMPAVTTSTATTTNAAPLDPGWVEFEETLPMSPYLLVIVWCDYVALMDPTSNNRVWAPRDKLHQAQLALNISCVVVEQCARYFGRDYPLPKLDHIPLPSLSNVAMENWGAITYKQEFLLWEEGVSTWAQREMTSYVVCHEIVHQWLGNLVTTAWWNTTWLNEGVTSFFHYLVMDKIEPTWNVMDTTFVTQVQMVFNDEVMKAPNPLTNNAYMPPENIVSSAFSATTYLKGAAVVRMVYNLMPPDIFREAIVQYVTENQYGSVDEEDFWQSIAAVADLPVDLEVVMYSWTHQPGFPLVTVHRSRDGCISVTQEKYLSEDETDIRWTIPITFTTSRLRDFNLTNTLWFSEDQDSLSLGECVGTDEWIVVNLRQSGYYRVNYDPLTWKALTHTLINGDISHIHPVNRAQLLNDGFDLARHGLLDYQVILDLSKYLRREVDVLPWAVAIQHLINLRLHFYNTTVFPYFTRYALDLVDGMFNQLTLTNDLGDLLPETHRRQIVEFACVMGHPRCVKEATVTTYLLMSGVNVRVPLDLKPMLLCTAVRHGQDEVWHFVVKEYLRASDNERWVYLEALACTNKPETVDRLLKKFVNPTFLQKDVNLLVEMGKQDDNLGPILDLILKHFHFFTTDLQFDVVLEVLKSFLKPYISQDQKQKINSIAELVRKRGVIKELDELEEILALMDTDDYKGLRKASVKEWFILNTERRRPKMDKTTSVPTFLKKHKVVHVKNSLNDIKSDKEVPHTEDSAEVIPTEGFSLTNSSSNVETTSKLLLTLAIILLNIVLR